jgi:hypothetical protein
MLASLLVRASARVRRSHNDSGVAGMAWGAGPFIGPRQTKNLAGRAFRFDTPYSMLPRRLGGLGVLLLLWR